MKLPQKAQSTIEYATIATLVIMGIIVMGPYIIRSINAHFRSLDDGIKDSFSEEIVQAPPQGFDIVTCDCPGLQSTATCGGSLCQPHERLYSQTCLPAGCEIGLKHIVTNDCRPDETCCTAWATATVCPDGPEGGKCCGVNAASVQGFGQPCADGHVLESRTCFTSPETTQYRCSAEVVPACVFVCSSDKGTTAHWCCDTTADANCYQKNLARNTATTFVAFGSAETPNANCTGSPCQAYCNDTWVPSPGGGGCVCPAGVLESNTIRMPHQSLVIDRDDFNSSGLSPEILNGIFTIANIDHVFLHASGMGNMEVFDEARSETNELQILNSYGGYGLDKSGNRKFSDLGPGAVGAFRARTWYDNHSNALTARYVFDSTSTAPTSWRVEVIGAITDDSGGKHWPTKNIDVEIEYRFTCTSEPPQVP